MNPFNESYKSPHVAPELGNDGTTDDFYDRLEESMGELQEHGEPADFKNLSRVFHLLFDFILKANLADRRCLRKIGIQAIAAAWVIDPARFGNSSLHEIGKRIGLGANSISPITADFSRRFKIVNHLQSHNWRGSNCEHKDQCIYVTRNKRQRITWCSDCGAEISRQKLASNILN